MCGRFTQYNTREEYLSWLADEATLDIPCDPTPIGRFNVTPGSKVLLLSERDTTWHLDPVMWSYAPPWWDKKQLINARIETPASSPSLHHCANMAERSLLPMRGMNGKKKAVQSSPL